MNEEKLGQGQQQRSTRVDTEADLEQRGVTCKRRCNVYKKKVYRKMPVDDSLADGNAKPQTNGWRNNRNFTRKCREFMEIHGAIPVGDGLAERQLAVDMLPIHLIWRKKVGDALGPLLEVFHHLQRSPHMSGRRKWAGVRWAQATKGKGKTARRQGFRVWAHEFARTQYVHQPWRAWTADGCTVWRGEPSSNIYKPFGIAQHDLPAV